jgi:hypothetical protein
MLPLAQGSSPHEDSYHSSVSVYKLMTISPRSILHRFRTKLSKMRVRFPSRRDWLEINRLFLDDFLIVQIAIQWRFDRVWRSWMPLEWATSTWSGFEVRVVAVAEEVTAVLELTDVLTTLIRKLISVFRSTNLPSRRALSSSPFCRCIRIDHLHVTLIVMVYVHKFGVKEDQSYI